MNSKQKLIFIILLIASAVFYSTGFAFNPDFSNEKFRKGSSEIKDEINKISLAKNSPKITNSFSNKENKFDLKTKASELGITEDKLSGLLKSAGKDEGDTIQTDAMTSTNISGLVSSEYFGFSVASAGDLNGDGFDDIIVGAPNNSVVASFAGKTYIYFGGTVMDDIPDVILSGTVANGNFGYSVTGAGDFNGDGYADVVVGAYTSGTSGKAFLYYGGAVMNNVADLLFIGAGSGSSFGYSVSSAGDMNADGYSDIIIGAPAESSSAGKTYIYFGGSSPNVIEDVTITGTGAEFSGYKVACVGDVNGDGYSDVIIGAPNANTYVGRALIFFGGLTVDNTPDVTLTGENSNDFFGYCVAGIGDMNGDGYDDVAVGAPSYHTLYANGGRAYVFFGGAAMNAAFDLAISGKSASESFGQNISSAGDINTDGYADLLVGSPYNSGQSPSGGAAFVYFGGITPDDISDAILYGSLSSFQFGYSLCSAGDINGDGIKDFIVSDPFTASPASGRILLYKNKLNDTDIPDLKFTASGTSEEFGYSLSNAGDVNGDGYSDLLVGAPDYSSLRGKAYLFFGGPNMDNVADATFLGEVINDEFGLHVSTAGDVNGDGFDDIIIGAPRWHGTGTAVGRAYIYFGGAVVDTARDITMTGQAANDSFGKVANAGDINGDGYPDVIVGAHGNDEAASAAGKVYLYYGGRTMDNAADVTFRGIFAGDGFGITLAGAGDVNGDGYGDFAVGTPYNNSNTGKVYVYYGGSTVDTTRDVILSGATPDEYFSYDIAGGFDFNKDGYADVVISSAYSSAGGSNSGKIYGFYGGRVMDNTSDFTITGTAGEYFGISINNARDVNKDGCNDLIVGTGRNRAYIYFGGRDITGVDPIVMTGSDNFGYDVSGTGDINGDGYADVFVSADYYNSLAGAAYLFLSSAPSGTPNMLYAKDVPNDQGGFLHLKFSRSGYDSPGMNKITGYTIEKSRAPGLGGYVWETEAFITAGNNPVYQYTAPTWSDSGAGTNKVYYRVTALTSIAGEYYRSNIVSGQSIDNLSPASPTGLLASPVTSTINLSWSANTEADLKDYLIYRNDTNIASSNSVSFADVTALPDLSYIYKIAARDIHGNISPLSTADTASLESITTINITVIPEGLLNTATNQLRMRDTVKAKLWDLTGSYIVDSATAVIDSVTFLASFTFKNAPTGNYYIAITHRNSIETWSKTGGESYTRGTTTAYDFTSANTQAYGNNLKLKGGRYCMYSGDVNSSGVINSTDRTLIRSNVGQTGYIKYDLDGNGVVNSADRTIVRNNTGIARQRP